MLLVSQYNTKPDGKVAKRAVKIKGKKRNIFCCVASVGAGLSFCCIYIEMPMATGNIKYGSADARS